MKTGLRSLAILLAAIVTPLGQTPAGAANPCLQFQDQTKLCPLPLTHLGARGDPDTILVAYPDGPGTTEFGAYFPTFPARSLGVGFDVFVKEGVAGAWLQALARVNSGGASATPDGSAPRGVYSPLTSRVAHGVPNPGAPGVLTVSAELPKSMSQRVKVAISDHGNVIWRSDSHAAGALAVVSDWPDGMRTETSPMGGLAFAWHFEHSAPIRVLHAADARDSSVTGDELRIEGPGAPSMSLSQVLFKASGMDSLTFAVPRVTRGPMPMSKSVRAGGGGAK